MEQIRVLQFLVKKEEEYSIDELSKQLLSTLKSLSEIIDKPNWYGYGKSWAIKYALNYPVSLTEEYVKKLLKAGWDKKFPDLGANFSITTGNNSNGDDYKLSLLLAVSWPGENIPNSIVVYFPTRINYNENQSLVLRIRACVEDNWDVIRFKMLD